MIVVTGASKGLGRAICERLLEKGFTVFGIARNVEGLPFPSIACDVSSYEQIKAVSQKLKKDGVKVTALINAAGIASMNLAVTTPPAIAVNMIQVNLLGTIYCCQNFAPLMLRNKAGSIVNFSTIAVALGLKGESIYAASKAGVEGFTRSFAREMADFNVKVNCIAPGPIDTNLLKGITSKQIQNIVSQQIIPKQFTPSAVSDLVEILLDDRSSALSGQILHVGGA
jgi:3-oxoacyl-[acyl-carrier protein] reductase